MATNKKYDYPDSELYAYVRGELDKRNINEKTVGEAAYELQHEYLPHLTVSDFGNELNNILAKREVLNILAMGFTIDNFAQKKQLPSPLQDIMENDAGVWQLDEMFAVSIAQLYGMLSVTNFGYADKAKVGWASSLDNSPDHITVFADDLFLALVSAVIGRCGHGSKLNLDDEDIAVNDTADNESDSIPTEEEFLNKVYGVDWNKLGDELEEAFTHDYYIAVSLTKHNVLRIDFADNSFVHEYSRGVSLHQLYKFISDCLSDNFGEVWQFNIDHNALESWLSAYIAAYMRNTNMYIDPEDAENNKLLENLQDNPSAFAAGVAEFLINVLGDGKESQHE